MGLKGKDFISIDDVDEKELKLILATAKKIKKNGIKGKPLKGKNIAVIFQKPSTRTRVSFEVAINRLGGNGIVLNWNELQLGRGETIEDTGRVLDRYVDCIVARVFSHEDLIRMANVAKAPVINALSDFEHPCQILADLLTIDEKIGLKNLSKIAFVGDGNNNVTHSLILACNKLKLPLTVGCPKEYRPSEKILSRVDGNLIRVVHDAVEAVKNADIVYTDTWVSMGKEEEAEKRIKIFMPFQVNEKLVSYAKENFLFMHDLPAKRGLEVTNEIIDGNHSIVWDQAENRLFSTMALLYLIL